MSRLHLIARTHRLYVRIDVSLQTINQPTALIKQGPHSHYSDRV